MRFIAYLTPANAMLSVELNYLADVLDDVKQLPNVSQQARRWSKEIHDAIWETTVRGSKCRVLCSF
jgi:meiotically up-regulated gene 157 (Mug157) protein